MELRSSTPVIAFATDNFESTPPPEALRHKNRRSRRTQYYTYSSGAREHRRPHSPSAFKVEQERSAKHRRRHRHESGAEPRRVQRDGPEHRRSRVARVESPPIDHPTENPTEGDGDHVIDIDDGASHEKESGSSIAPIAKSRSHQKDAGVAQHNAAHAHRRTRRKRREYPHELERPRRREYPDRTERPRDEGARHRHHRDAEGGTGRRRRDVDRDLRSTRDYHENSGSAEGRKRPLVDGERRRHRRRRVPSREPGDRRFHPRERHGDRRPGRDNEGGFLSRLIEGFRKMFSK